MSKIKQYLNIMKAVLYLKITNQTQSNIQKKKFNFKDYLIEHFLFLPFNRSLVFSLDDLRKQMRRCELFIYFDFFAILICSGCVVLISSYLDTLFSFGVALFTVWIISDFVFWFRFAKLYFKYFEGGVIFEDPESDKAKDSEKEI